MSLPNLTLNLLISVGFLKLPGCGMSAIKPYGWLRQLGQLYGWSQPYSWRTASRTAGVQPAAQLAYSQVYSQPYSWHTASHTAGVQPTIQLACSQPYSWLCHLYTGKFLWCLDVFETKEKIQFPKNICVAAIETSIFRRQLYRLAMPSVHLYGI